MAKNLLIVESPAKSRTLSRFLGKDFEILSTIGHLIDLPKSALGVDVNNDFQPNYEVIDGKEKVLSKLRKAAESARAVYLAPDPDREGEAIAWHVANNLPGSRAKVHRVTFNEITKSAVTEAIKNPRDIDLDLVNAQQARRVLDRLVGYMVSPFLWKTVARNLSAGRVQSVALRLICERDVEIANFVAEEYWKIKANLSNSSDESFWAVLFKIDNQTVVKAGETTRNSIVITNEADARAIEKDLHKQKYQVAELKRTERIRRPPAPFITSTLQQEAAKVHGMSPKRTMAIAQALYEGVELGKEGPVGLITYMRTDSTRIAGEAITAVRDHIAAEYGASYLPSKPRVYGKQKQAQDAHEAIRPTYLTLAPDKVRKSLTPPQYKLYKLIWNRFVASQMKDAVYDIETVDITGGKYLLRAKSQRIKFDGFLKVYHEEKEPDENGNGDNGYEQLPAMEEGESLKLNKVESEQSFTKPPARYSEAMLVKRLEADGIGRPSTYAMIISTLKERKYVDLTEKKLHPTDLGVTVNGILVEHFPKIFNVQFTAGMEKELDLVEEGKDDWVDVVREFYEPFSEQLSSLKGKERQIKAAMVETTDVKCPKCQSPMVIKWGRNGRFLACSSWPKCKSTQPLPEEAARNQTDEKCDKCGSPMVVKSGRFGRFMACSAYPECKNTKPLTLGVKCPKKGCNGKVIEKTTRTKRTFFGCTNYPKCDFASWDRPVATPCPVCSSPYMLQKSSKVKGEYLRCPECKHEMVEEQPAENTTPA
ncbi:MAG: type I DNA topoisomerase [Candidatus Zixiibacteriota bacterium]